MQTTLKAAKTLLLTGMLAAAGCGGPPPQPDDPPVVHHAPAVAWYAPLYRVPANPSGTEEGRIRILVGVKVIEDRFEETEETVVSRGMRLLLSGLRPATAFRAEVEGDPVPVPFGTDDRGRASVLLGRTFAAPGKRILVSDASGNPVLLGAVPDWSRRPRGEGPRRESFGAADGSLSVRVETNAGSGRGRERLTFRFEGVAFGAGLTLGIGGDPGIRIVPGENGEAILDWRSEGASPLPLGAASVRKLQGTLFEVRSPGGATVLGGTIP